MTTLISSRTEAQVFNDLETLCRHPGYLHLLAGFIYEDSLVKAEETVTRKAFVAFYASERLMRSELTLLLGLVLKSDRDLSLPPKDDWGPLAEQTIALLKELHDIAQQPLTIVEALRPQIEGRPEPDLGTAMREPIFYGGVSAYAFQYEHFAEQKYAEDDEWLVAHKGFTIREARSVVGILCRYQHQHFHEKLAFLEDRPEEESTYLHGFRLTFVELAQESGIDESKIRQVAAAFMLPAGERNAGFVSPITFNVATTYPLIPDGDGFFLLQTYAFLEALYEGPFFWMCRDKPYGPQLSKHRGAFTEQVALDCLTRVFGAKHVHHSVTIDANKERYGEIDVLVVFGNRAIVVQAKAKRLTLLARHGATSALKKDFKLAVQEAYDQGVSCAKVINNSGFEFSSGGKPLILPRIDEIFIVCLLADHFPALSFISRTFLKVEVSERVPYPLILDVFALEVMAELLDSPLRFLSYIERRARYGDRVLANSELAVLGYHLSQNLWVGDQDIFWISDDHLVDLEVAMVVRHEGAKGERTPPGILTQLKGTSVGQLIERIEREAQPPLITFGLLLLRFPEPAALTVSEALDAVVTASQKDHLNHDVTLPFRPQSSGLSIHCSDAPVERASRSLMDHCERRKYRERAATWFGLCVAPDGQPRLGVSLAEPWQQNADMDRVTHRMAEPVKIDWNKNTLGERRKVGRNDICSCGSRKKYKRCCLTQGEP